MPQDHGRPGPRSHDAEEMPSARAPSHAERCRTLARATRSAALSTIAREPAGFPYGSLVTVAFDGAGRPVLLLSKLAEHTQNLLASSDASLLLTDPLDAHPEPLAASRVTLLGPCCAVPAGEQGGARELFLAAHPSASYYVEFKDFGFYRLQPIALRYVGGFGRMSWVSADEYAAAEPDPLAAAAASIVKHMNDDHEAAVVLFAKVLAAIEEVESAKMTAVDRYGFELAVVTKSGPRAARLAFEQPVTTTDEVRRTMVAMVKAARAASV